MEQCDLDVVRDNDDLIFYTTEPDIGDHEKNIFTFLPELGAEANVVLNFKLPTNLLSFNFTLENANVDVAIVYTAMIPGYQKPVQKINPKVCFVQ